MITPTRTVSTSSITILVGITGHWDLIPANLPKHKSILIGRPEKTREMAAGFDVTAISALAGGVDRISSETALDLHLEPLAVRPMPRAEYAEDLTDPRSLMDFRTALTKPGYAIEQLRANVLCQRVSFVDLEGHLEDCMSTATQISSYYDESKPICNESLRSERTLLATARSEGRADAPPESAETSRCAVHLIDKEATRAIRHE